MNRALTDTIKEQTQILLHNFKTAIETCDMNYILCGAPVWKHIYHALHSCDQWFINPERYTEPPFHEPALNSLDHWSEKRLSRGELLDYFADIQDKVMRYLDELTDDMLYERPEDCRHNRLALILGQYRHMYVHMGNINATTMIAAGKWPRVVGLNGDLTLGLYE